MLVKQEPAKREHRQLGTTYVHKRAADVHIVTIYAGVKWHCGVSASFDNCVIYDSSSSLFRLAINLFATWI